MHIFKSSASGRVGSGCLQRFEMVCTNPRKEGRFYPLYHFYMCGMYFNRIELPYLSESYD